MISAGQALQQAIHAALIADAPLLALLGGPRVHDDVPRGTPFPYITFGQSTARDWGTSTEDGEEHLLTVHVWSRQAGRKQVVAVLRAVRDRLHTATLTLTDHRLVNLRQEFTEARRDADGETYRGIARYRAVTEPLG